MSALLFRFLVAVALIYGAGQALNVRAQTLLLLGAGKGTASSCSFSQVFGGHKEDTAGGTTVTYSSVAFGTASTNRKLGIAISWRPNASGDTISSVTFPGSISASQVSGAYANSTDLGIADIWVGTVPTGTSGNVVVVFSANSSRSSVAVYNATGCSAPTLGGGANAKDGGGAALTQTLTVPSGGAGFGMFFCRNAPLAGDVIWTNAVGDYSADQISGVNTATIGSATVAATASVTGTVTGCLQATALTLASWTP